MIFEITVVVAVLLVWLSWFILSTSYERKGMPPGPYPLPFIGNVHQLGQDPPFTLENLREKYGDVYTFSTPVGNFVVVNSGKLAKDLLVMKKDDFAGRPKASFFPMTEVFMNKDIPSSDYSPSLIFRRKIVKSALRLFGEGTKVTEERVVRDIESFLQRIEETNEQAFSIHDHISALIINMLCERVLSTRYSVDDIIIKKLANFGRNILFLGKQGSIFQFFPFLKYFSRDFMSTFKDVIQTRDEFFGSHLESHRQTYEKGIIRDITDALLLAYDNERDKHHGKDIGTSDDVMFLMLNIILAGTDTSTTVLTWFMLYMIVHRNVQEKIQDEIDNATPKGSSPNWRDSESYPYLLATMCEVMRHSAFVPFLPPHKAIRDTTIAGFRIPKDTAVLVNLWRIHRDPNEWEDSEMFKPERFLDENCKFIGWEARSDFLPFGAGPRICIGIAMAKQEIFTVAGKLLQRFTLHVPENEPIPSLKGEANAIRCPKHYTLVAKKRY
ncbi:steroid 17-alpha-hydroxylase/17,20 lyase-like [Dendronephthya gigantea]|uniref:steroid 17-alpha-hydroxylase/17,20 lyase-like n=1 Tax=Dendronephthya gigantea TaxID=151771 RepID=UPI00106B1C7C|nr:steroid 17-alpha-hydroxylase/17,20 lyase-like [Dendronephthya gigantea]